MGKRVVALLPHGGYYTSAPLPSVMNTLILGAPGTGKTSLLIDLARRAERVLYISTTDARPFLPYAPDNTLLIDLTGKPVPINPVTPHLPELFADLARHFTGHSFYQDIFDRLVRYGLMTVSDRPDRSLLMLKAVLQNDVYRASFTPPPLAQAFWEEYVTWSERAYEERIQGLLTYIDRYLTTPTLARHFATHRHTDHDGSIVVHAPVSVLGPEGARTAALTVLSAVKLPTFIDDAELLDGTTLARTFTDRPMTVTVTTLPHYAGETLLSADEKVIFRTSNHFDFLNLRPGDVQLYELQNFRAYHLASGQLRATRFDTKPLPRGRKPRLTDKSLNPNTQDRTISKFVRAHIWQSSSSSSSSPERSRSSSTQRRASKTKW